MNNVENKTIDELLNSAYRVVSEMLESRSVPSDADKNTRYSYNGYTDLEEFSLYMADKCEDLARVVRLMAKKNGPGVIPGLWKVLQKIKTIDRINSNRDMSVEKRMSKEDKDAFYKFLGRQATFMSLASFYLGATVSLKEGDLDCVCLYGTRANWVYSPFIKKYNMGRYMWFIDEDYIKRETTRIAVGYDRTDTLNNIEKVIEDLLRFNVEYDENHSYRMSVNGFYGQSEYEGKMVGKLRKLFNLVTYYVETSDILEKAIASVHDLYERYVRSYPSKHKGESRVRETLKNSQDPKSGYYLRKLDILSATRRCFIAEIEAWFRQEEAWAARDPEATLAVRRYLDSALADNEGEGGPIIGLPFEDVIMGQGLEEDLRIYDDEYIDICRKRAEKGSTSH